MGSLDLGNVYTSVCEPDPSAPALFRLVICYIPRRGTIHRMPTHDQTAALTFDRAWTRAGELAFPREFREDRLEGIGLEPEYFPVFCQPDGRPSGRVPLLDPAAPGVLDVIDGMVCEDSFLGSRRGGPIGPWEYPLADDGRLTFEPGAQVEHSTGVYPNSAVALEDIQRVLDCL